MDLSFSTAIWLAPLAWSLHLAEEGVRPIDTFARKHFFLAVVALNGFIWTALTAWPRNARFAAFLTLPFFVYFSFANVLQHLYRSAHFRTGAPA